tara:strand:- start:246 stop:668 length:423 start_codon:yes stop_codon:yes gene_type:complete
MANLDLIKKLYKENNLTKEHIHNGQYTIILRTGIDKIISKQNIDVVYEIEKLESDWVVIKAIASFMKGGTFIKRESYGESDFSNLPIKKKRNGTGEVARYPVAMAEKRAMSRSVLKLTGFYELGVMSEDEIVVEEKTSLL